jgi:hypothetical protein
MNKHTFFDKLRVTPWLVAALTMAAIVGWLYPHQLGVLLWALTKLSFGAYLGYWIDRSIFYYARPGDINVRHADRYTALLVAACMLRRAAIMAATIVALGLGV